MTQIALQTASNDLVFEYATQHITGRVVSIVHFTEQEITGSGGGGGGTISGGGGTLAAGSGSISSIKGSITIDPIEITSQTRHIQNVFIEGNDGKEYVFQLDADQLSLRDNTIISFLWFGEENAPRTIRNDHIILAYNHNTNSNWISNSATNTLFLTEGKVGTASGCFSSLAIIGVGMWGIFTISPLGWLGNIGVGIATLCIAKYIHHTMAVDRTDYDHEADKEEKWDEYLRAITEFEPNKLT